MPAGAEALAAAGRTVFVEQGAGAGSGFSDEAYRGVGATILPTADDVWQQAEMIMKVKEPIAVEWPRMRRGPGDLHLLPLCRRRGPTVVIDSGAIAVATGQFSSPAASSRSSLRCPKRPAGWRSGGANYLEKVFGGSGILLGGVPGVAPGRW